MRPDASPIEERALPGEWRYVADAVMGGVSRGGLTEAVVAGRPALRLAGTVSTENDGGFIQASLGLAGDAPFDASAWLGIALDVIGNDERYELRLRTDGLDRPWQSFRFAFRAARGWTTLRVAFADFEPHRTDRPFDAARLARLGVLAVGRAFEAEVAFAAPRLWR